MPTAREEGREKDEPSRGCLATLVATVALAATASLPRAQTWSQPFQHNGVHPPGANASSKFTSPYSPWSLNPGSTAPAPTALFTPPQVLPPNIVTSSGPVFGPDRGWPQPDPQRSFNAVHMSVIPKGPYRGMVLVWNNLPVLAVENPWMVPSLPPASQPWLIPVQAYQAYAIVDPADQPLDGIRYRNFVVPIGDPFEIDPAQLPYDNGQNLFCAGHAWSPFGDLVVVGGTKYVDNGFGILYGAGLLTYVFNPRLQCYWPGLSTQYYETLPAPRSDFWGMWVQGPDLELPRWYATATLTHRLARAPDGLPALTDRERILVLGGSETIPAAANEGANRTYEALTVVRESQLLSSELVIDKAVGPYYVHSTPTSTEVWNGPGITLGTQEVDWLLEYPRCHLLSDGRIFFSGYAPQWGKLDHDTNPGIWTKAPGQPAGTYSSNWQDIRHDGSSVLFPNFGGNADVVARIGGIGHSGPTTATMESISVAGANDWVSAPAMPNTDPANYFDGSRTNMNAVILPTGGILILGGLHVRPSGGEDAVYAPLLFENGKWAVLPANPTPSRRTYHSTAVLLPDGRVLLGGGDDRDYDYEIFSPEYLSTPQNRPQNVKWQAPAPQPDAATGADLLAYDERYDIACDNLPLGHAIAKVVLTAPCSVTHHSDMHQRYIELDTDVQGGNLATFSVPSTEQAAPRGIYMLWLVTTTGAVSDAKWVVLR